MKKIGLLADTHHYIGDDILRALDPCDEVWHAGDFGTIAVAEQIAARKPLHGVYGNIDGRDIRSVYPEKLRWTCEDVEVYMTHIGGYPPRYTPAVRAELYANPPQLFICGHSHILKIMFDEKIQCLHMNPGAAGKQGWHTMRTLLRFVIDGKNITQCEVVELGQRGA